MAIISTGLGGMIVPPTSQVYTEVVASRTSTYLVYLELDRVPTQLDTGGEIELQKGPVSAPTWVSPTNIDTAELANQQIALDYTGGLTGGIRILSSPVSFDPPLRPQTYVPDTVELALLNAIMDAGNSRVIVMVDGHVAAGTQGLDTAVTIWSDETSQNYYPTASSVSYNQWFSEVIFTGWPSEMFELITDFCTLQISDTAALIVPSAGYVWWHDIWFIGVSDP